jgi:hypothetical protein
MTALKLLEPLAEPNLRLGSAQLGSARPLLNKPQKAEPKLSRAKPSHDITSTGNWSHYHHKNSKN